MDELTKRKIKIWTVIFFATLAVAGGLAILFTGKTGLFKGSAGTPTCGSHATEFVCSQYDGCAWDGDLDLPDAKKCKTTAAVGAKVALKRACLSLTPPGKWEWDGDGRNGDGECTRSAPPLTNEEIYERFETLCERNGGDFDFRVGSGGARIHSCNWNNQTFTNENDLQQAIDSNPPPAPAAPLAPVTLPLLVPMAPAVTPVTDTVTAAPAAPAAPPAGNPTIAITSPSNNSIITGLIHVNVTASAEIQKVKLLMDGKLVKEIPADSTLPFSFNLDTTKLSNGTHTISVNAYLSGDQPLFFSPPPSVEVTVANQTILNNMAKNVGLGTTGQSLDIVEHLDVAAAGLQDDNTSLNQQGAGQQVGGQAAQTNLIVDGDMEAATVEPWVKYGQPTEPLKKDHTEFRSGNSSLYLDSTHTSAGLQQLAIPVRANGRYKFSFYYKFGSAAGSITPRLGIRSSNADFGGAAIPAIARMDNAWRKYERDFTVPASFVADFRVVITGINAQVYIDEAKIEEIAAVQDDMGPTVAITSPQAENTVSGTTTVTANITDAHGIKSAALFVDGSDLSNRVGSDNIAPYEFSWDTRTATDARHTLKVIAWDNDNNVNSQEIAVIVNNRQQPQEVVPQITITPAADNPQAGDITEKGNLFTAAKLDFAVSNQTDVDINRIAVSAKEGIANALDILKIESLQLYTQIGDVAPNQLSEERQMDGSGRITFDNINWGIHSPHTQKLVIKAKLRADAYNDKKFAFGIKAAADIHTVGTSTIGGAFPVMGGEFTTKPVASAQAAADAAAAQAAANAAAAQAAANAAAAQAAANAAAAQTAINAAAAQTAINAAAAQAATSACEQRGLHTYTGPAKPGVRIPGMCIACSTDTYITNGGTCEAPQNHYTTSLNDSSPSFEEASTIEAGAQTYRPPSGARSSSLSGSQRLVSAPERGNAGPEILIYPLVVAMANGAYFLVRRKKKRGHK